MLVEDSFGLSALFVSVGVFLVVFGMFMVQYMIGAFRDPRRKDIAEKMLAFMVLSIIYIIIELLDGLQVASTMSQLHALNTAFGIILLALFCVFTYRNSTSYRGVVKFSIPLALITLISATAAIVLGAMENTILNDPLLSVGILGTACSISISIFSFFGNLMILDFIINNRERGGETGAVGGND